MTTPETIFLEKEEHLRLFEAIDQLTDLQKEIVILRKFNELTFKEIGDVFTRSENWARVTFYRAKLQLRRTLR